MVTQQIILTNEQVKLLQTASVDLKVPLEEVVQRLFTNLSDLQMEWPDSFRMLVK